MVQSFNKIESLLTSLLPAAALVFCAPAAFAQEKSPNSTQQRSAQPASSSQPAGSSEKTPAPGSAVTRTRRAALDPQDGKADHPATIASESTETNPTGDAQASSDAETAAMREEINSAPIGYERSRLQLKLVEHLAAKGLKQEAVTELQSLSNEQRFDPPGFYNIANAQARLGDSESAVNTYRKAIDQRKGHYSRALNNLGVVLLRLGRWDEAYDAFMSAMRLEGFRYAEASYNLGRLYAARGENDLAVREWRRALKVDPEHPAAASAITTLGSGGSITIAAHAPKTVAKPSGANDSNENSGKGERMRSTSASETRSKPRPFGVRTPPTLTVDRETYALLLRGRTAREKGRHEEAADNYRRVMARMGGYFPPANLELGYSLIALKRSDEAIASLLPVAMREGARFPISYYHLARLYELRGELKLAEENYRRAAEAYGESNTQFLLDLSRVREKLGDSSGALASLEKYLSILEAQGQKPAWSAERLATLQSKLNQSQKKEPKQ